MNNVQILGVSVDSQFSHLAWVQTDRKSGGLGDLAYPLVADLKKEISDSFQVLTEEGIALRGLFIIDRVFTTPHTPPAPGLSERRHKRRSERQHGTHTVRAEPRRKSKKKCTPPCVDTSEQKSGFGRTYAKRAPSGIRRISAISAHRCAAASRRTHRVALRSTPQPRASSPAPHPPLLPHLWGSSSWA